LTGIGPDEKQRCGCAFGSVGARMVWICPPDPGISSSMTLEHRRAGSGSKTSRWARQSLLDPTVERGSLLRIAPVYGKMETRSAPRDGGGLLSVIDTACRPKEYFRPEASARVDATTGGSNALSDRKKAWDAVTHATDQSVVRAGCTDWGARHGRRRSARDDFTALGSGPFSRASALEPQCPPIASTRTPALEESIDP
jgi:hypothetical protein